MPIDSVLAIVCGVLAMVLLVVWDKQRVYDSRARMIAHRRACRQKTRDEVRVARAEIARFRARQAAKEAPRG